MRAKGIETSIENEFLEDGFRKVTGPIEHWVTTIETGYWRFRLDKEETLRGIEENGEFLFKPGDKVRN